MVPRLGTMGPNSMVSDWSRRDADLVEHRIDSVLRAARESRTSVGLDSLSELLPTPGPEGSAEVSEWLVAHPDVGRLVGDRAAAGPVPSLEESRRRQERGRRFMDEAAAVVVGPLADVSSLVRCVAVTGSAAYGEPAPQDDLDFLVVTRPGSVWPFLLYSYLAARRRPAHGRDDGPSHWCFNYILDERAAREEFVNSRGFLFAREALTARPVAGEPYYRGLIGSAGWLAEEVPRLYQRWSVGGLPPLPPQSAAPLALRIANAALFPLLATYLTLIALVRNRRLTREGRSTKRFRVNAHLDRLTYETERFEELRTLYTPANLLHRQEAP
ncbi:MAG: hypothetical protein L3K18_00425 [Thermoplasmata archaeon]|nr:hypothetical protein [Thermoplasmata archaeon]MCI4355596.1 hypothetical protein [Thermoplasmata archaeon]